MRDDDRTHGRDPADNEILEHSAVHAGAAPTTTTITLPAPTTTTVTLPPPEPGYVSDDCDSGPAVFDGHVDGLYAKVRTFQSGGETWICVAADGGGAHHGARIVVGSASGLPHVDSDPASANTCEGTAGNTPVTNGSVLGQDVRVHVTPSGSSPDGPETWVCVKLTNDSSRWRRVDVPKGTPRAVLVDPSAPHAPYPDDDLPLAATESDDCRDGGGLRHLNADVGNDEHVWVYTRQETSRTHICVRVEGTQDKGGRLTVDTAAHPGVSPVVTTATLASRTAVIAACPHEIADFTDPALVHLRYDTASPPEICFDLAGTRRRVTVGADEAATVAWHPDPGP